MTIIIIGAHLSGALTGRAAFAPTRVASLVFVRLHRSPAHASLHVQPLSRLLKGQPKPLVADGETQPDTLRKEAITVRDLEAAMRLRGLRRLEEVRTATLKRKGALSRRPMGAGPQGARPVRAV